MPPRWERASVGVRWQRWGLLGRQHHLNSEERFFFILSGLQGAAGAGTACPPAGGDGIPVSHLHHPGDSPASTGIRDPQADVAI